MFKARKPPGNFHNWRTIGEVWYSSRKLLISHWKVIYNQIHRNISKIFGLIFVRLLQGHMSHLCSIFLQVTCFTPVCVTHLGLLYQSNMSGFSIFQIFFQCVLKMVYVCQYTSFPHSCFSVALLEVKNPFSELWLGPGGNS